MLVKAVGTSCTWFERLNTSFILDNCILLDTPQGSYKTIKKYIVLEKDVKYIFITHFHSDHFTDLHTILDHIMKKSDKKKFVTVFGPKGIRKRLLKLYDILAVSKLKKPAKEYFNFVEVRDGMKIEIDDYFIVPYKMLHEDLDSYGYVFKSKKTNKTVGFTGDTGYCNNLSKMLAICDAVFIDTSSIEEEQKHLCVDEILKFKKDYNKTKFYCVHLTDKARELGKQKKLNVLDDGDIVEIN